MKHENTEIIEERQNLFSINTTVKEVLAATAKKIINAKNVVSNNI